MLFFPCRTLFLKVQVCQAVSFWLVLIVNKLKHFKLRPFLVSVVDDIMCYAQLGGYLSTHTANSDTAKDLLFSLPALSMFHQGSTDGVLFSLSCISFFFFFLHEHKTSVCLTPSDRFSWDKSLWSSFAACFELHLQSIFSTSKKKNLWERLLVEMHQWILVVS